MSESSFKPDPSVLTGITKAPFVRLPDPASFFSARADRLRFLAESSDLAPYLTFLASISDAQAAILADLPPVAAPEEEVLARSREFAMPPCDRSAFTIYDGVSETLTRLFDAFEPIAKPETAEKALATVKTATEDALGEMVRNILADTIPAAAMAEHVYLAAGLQLHFSRLAATLDAAAIVPVSTGLCPVCGSRPTASLVVGWYRAEGARYAACSLCATLWNEVRVKCLACGSTKGVGYQEVEDGSGTVKAETCDECESYLKVCYQHKDTAMEAVADDVASLGLDILLRHGGKYRRAGVNAYLLGY